jgi:hypothetical protein
VTRSDFDGIRALSAPIELPCGLVLPNRLVNAAKSDSLVTVTGETPNVYEGNVTMRVPITQNSTAGDEIDGKKMITLNLPRNAFVHVDVSRGSRACEQLLCQNTVPD